jgi:hypothetical protein
MYYNIAADRYSTRQTHPIRPGKAFGSYLYDDQEVFPCMYTPTGPESRKMFLFVDSRSLRHWVATRFERLRPHVDESGDALTASPPSLEEDLGVVIPRILVRNGLPSRPLRSHG